jgi:hypothetical protein
MQKNSQAYGITVVAFTRKYLGYRIFHSERRYFLLASLSKDNPRVELAEVREGFLWLLGLRIAKLHLCLLTLGTGDHLVCQAMPAYSSMPYPNMGDYKGWIGLSPPAAYPSTVEYEANEGSRQPRHHVYAISYYSSIRKGLSIFIRALY